MFTRVVVFASPQEVADTVAHKFLERVVDLLGSRDEVQVCLTGGGTADLVYERFADLAAEAKLDLGRLHLWWGDERFVAVPIHTTARQSMRLNWATPIST